MPFVWALMIFGTLAAASPSILAQEAAISPNLSNNVGNAFAYVWGMQFVPNEDLVVTDLGWFDANSNGFTNGPHDVAIYRVSDQQILAQASCTNSSVVDDGFRYEAIPPISLRVGQQYLVVGFDNVGSGDHVLSQLTFSNINSHPEINVEGTRDQSGVPGLIFPSGSLDTTPSSWLMGANFKFHVSDQDQWSGNGPIGGNYYFSHFGNWTDFSAPSEFDNARFLFSDQTVSWSDSFGGDTISRNLFANNSDLVFRSLESPAKTHSVLENADISGGSLALGDASNPVNLDISGNLLLNNAELELRSGSCITA